MTIANDPIYTRTKYIEIDYHFIRKHTQSKKIQVQHIHFANQPADILTKVLPTQQFLSLKQANALSLAYHLEGR